MTRILTFALLLLGAACGGKDKAPTTTTMAHEGGEHHEGSGSGDEHENLTPELSAFHDLLAPHWHADKGPQRTADTCSAIAQFKSSADAVAVATPPVSTNADTWTAATRALVAAVAELERACTSKSDTKFDAAFTKVHEAFHSLMAQSEAAGNGNKTGAGSADEHGTAPGTHEHSH